MNLSLSSLFSHVSFHGRFHKLQEIFLEIVTDSLPLLLGIYELQGPSYIFISHMEEPLEYQVRSSSFSCVVFGLKESNLKLKRCIQYAIAGVRLYSTFLAEFLRETIAAAEWTKGHFHVLKLQIYAYC